MTIIISYSLKHPKMTKATKTILTDDNHYQQESTYLFLSFLVFWGIFGIYTFSKKVSGRLGLKISLQYMTVTRSSVSLKLMILCV